jgi:hypothetical protein
MAQNGYRGLKSARVCVQDGGTAWVSQGLAQFGTRRRDYLRLRCSQEAAGGRKRTTPARQVQSGPIEGSMLLEAK